MVRCLFFNLQMSYDNDDWDDEWDDDDSEPGGTNYLNGAGNFGLSGANRSAKPSGNSVSDVSNTGLSLLLS